MINYKTKLKANELQVIEHISYNSKTQLTLQSIYSYIVKHTTLNNGSFPKPLIDLYKMYIRYHNKISCIYFRKLIKKLVDYKMVIVNKHRNTNVYSVNRSIKLFSIIPKVSQKVSQKVSSSKIAETVGTSTLQSTVQDTELKLELNNTITIIDNTVVPTELKPKLNNSSAYEKAIEENNKDLVEPTELIKAAINKLKEQGRRSKKIIARLETKLAKRNNINRKGMDMYLDVVVADAIAFYEVGREKMALFIATKKAKYNSAYNLKKNKSNIAKANFTQRKYDCDKLEAQLLGWDDSEDDCEIGHIKSTIVPANTNFTQRVYDYNKLENQLLGLDNSDDDCQIDIIKPIIDDINSNCTQRKYD